MTRLATPIRFALSPSFGEVKEHVRAELFGRALAARLGRPVVVQIAASFEALERELVEDQVDIVWGTSEQCTAFEPRALNGIFYVRGANGAWEDIRTAQQ